MRVYLDASTIIYSIEAASPFREEVLDRIAKARGSAPGAILTSRLSRLECRTKPLRDGNKNVLSAYDTYLTGGMIELIDINSAIIEKATDLRARYRLKTPDAIHVATAIEERADLLLTGDSDLSRCTEITVDVL